MKKSDYKKLKKGDKVTLAEDMIAYGFHWDVWGHRVGIPKGATGVIGAVDVPFVRGPERTFVCVDFPPSTQLINPRDGGEITVPNPHKSSYRVAAIESQLK